MSTSQTPENEYRGYVARCKCGNLQLAFGTTLLSLSRQQFYELASVVSNLNKRHSSTPAPYNKMIQIPLVTNNTAMVCNVSELKSLSALIAEGIKNLEYEELFAFSNN